MVSAPLLRRSLCLGVALVLLAAAPVLADPGDLDPTFGGDGVVEIVAPPIPVHTLRGGDLAADANGALWVVASDQHSYSGLEASAVITRLRSNGSLDHDFGDAGQVVWRFRDTGENPVTRAGDPVAINGGVQVSGIWSDGLDGDATRFVARFRANGRLDRGFGRQGVLSYRPKRFNGGLVATAADGAFWTCDYVGKKLSIWAHRPDGDTDPGFGEAGRTTVRVPGSPAYQGVAVCAATTDGGVLVGSLGGYQAQVFRGTKFTADGTLDPTYGDDGRSVVRSPEGVRLNAAAVRADGSVRFVGTRSGEPAVLALGPDGERDVEFGGGDGLVVLAIPGLPTAIGMSISLAANGVVALTGTASGDPDQLPFVSRVSAAGVLDTGFGDGGATWGYADEGFASSVAVDTAGRLVAASTTTRLTGPVTVARFQR